MFQKKYDTPWCGRGDLNPHDFHRWNLNPVRLPIPPRPRLVAGAAVPAVGANFLSQTRGAT